MEGMEEGGDGLGCGVERQKVDCADRHLDG
jgi:hypothetical protein